MKRIKITDYVDETTSMIVGREFKNVEIWGPAIIVPLNGCVFEGNVFDGAFDRIFRSVPEDAVLVGVIGLQATAFLGCQFHNVGLWGPEALIQQFGKDLLRSPEKS